MNLKSTLLPRRLLLGTLVASTIAVVGCSSEHPDPFPGQDITNSYHDYIPITAVKVAEAAGSVTYTADAQGTAYIVDLSRLTQTTEKTAVPHVMGSVLLLKGQSLTVDAANQTITTGPINTVTGTSFKNTNLKPDSTYQLFFDKEKHTKM